ALLYDTGPRVNDTIDAGGRIILPFLRAAGIRRLDVLVISHADSDHAGGAPSILEGVPVAQMTSSLPAEHSLVKRANVYGQAIRCIEGASWTWDGVLFTMLHPARRDYDDAARKS